MDAVLEEGEMSQVPTPTCDPGWITERLFFRFRQICGIRPHEAFCNYPNVLGDFFRLTASNRKNLGRIPFSSSSKG
jgi:hypothetical protein